MTSIPWNVFTRQPVNRIVVGEGPLESFKLSMLNAEAFWPHRETRTSLPLSEKNISKCSRWNGNCECSKELCWCLYKDMSSRDLRGISQQNISTKVWFRLIGERYPFRFSGLNQYSEYIYKKDQFNMIHYSSRFIKSKTTFI